MRGKTVSGRNFLILKLGIKVRTRTNGKSWGFRAIDKLKKMPGNKELGLID